jgi:UDP-galactose transporter B1
VNKQIRFCAYHPWALFDLVVVSCFQVLGQASIYYVIANFKQHMFPLISTTRKVGTVFLSILVYGHKVNLWQWIGIFSVFGGMTYEVIDEIKDKKAK